MTTLTQRLDDYLAVRRSLGFDLSFSGRVLRGLPHSPIARASVTSRPISSCVGSGVRQGQQQYMVGASRHVRVFAGWLQGQDMRTEVPPAGTDRGEAAAGTALHLLRQRDRHDHHARREAQVPIRPARVDVFDPVLV